MNFRDNAQVQKLAKALDLEIIDYKMENERDTEHQILHRFTEEVIVPIHSITNNMAFLCCKGKKTIYTVDHVKSECVEWKELHMMTMEDEVERLYHTDVMSFCKKWFKYDPKMVSMTYIYMKLKKKEE